MAETSWPFAAGAGAAVGEDQWSIMAREWASSGVIGVPGDQELQVFADNSGREVHVRPGRATVRGHWYVSDSQVNLTIAANTSGNPRIDRIVLRLDPVANSVVLAVKQGTAAASPVAPALTMTDTGVYEISLAQVSVANGVGSLAAGSVTDERDYGPITITPCTSTRRPWATRLWQLIVETDTGAIKTWNGSVWVDIAAVDTVARTAANTGITAANLGITAANAAQASANAAQATANSAQSTANAALPKAGGTVTGSVYVDNAVHAREELLAQQKFYLNRDAAPVANGPGGINIIDFGFLVVPTASGGAVQQVQKYSGLAIRDVMIFFSARRYKTHVTAADAPDTSALTPVEFRWREGAPALSGEIDRAQLGLIADDVAEVDSRLVTHDVDGEVAGLNVTALIAALVAKTQQLENELAEVRTVITAAQEA